MDMTPLPFVTPPEHADEQGENEGTRVKILDQICKARWFWASFFGFV